MSDKTPDTPTRGPRDAKRTAENDAAEMDRGSPNAPSDIEQNAEPSPEDPEMGMNYLQDDPDRQRDGVHARPLTEEYEDVARRNELIRRVDDTVTAARSWAEETDDESAQEVLEHLIAAADRLGESVEDTDRETNMDRRGEEPS